MPRFSICISTYNDAEYLSACLDSVLEQSFSDFELIVIDDKSTDSTSDVLRSYSEQDKRIRVFTKDANQGVHLCRKDAVSLAVGEYILFLDSDDCFAPETLERLNSALLFSNADYLHFGMKVIPCGSTDRITADSLARQANSVPSNLNSNDVLKASYLSFECDWRVTQRVFSSQLAKRAFSLMNATGLGAGEDAYENYILCSLAKTIHYDNSIVGYIYFLGRGSTGSETYDAKDWLADMKAYVACGNAVQDYVENNSGNIAYARSLREKLFESGMNSWHEHLSPNDQEIMLPYAIELCGNGIVASHLMRFARDEAYDALKKGRSFDGASEYYSLYRKSKEIAGNECSSSTAFLGYFVKAKSHIEDLRHRAVVANYSDKEVRIFVSTHKRVNLFNSSILQPVQVGCALRQDSFSWALHDNTGDNISQLNPMYCELTTQYWAWKNTCSPYVGFCHYRRYFDFNPKIHNENEYGEIIDQSIDDFTQRKYMLVDSDIEKYVRSYDVITTVSNDVRRFMGPRATVRDHYAAAPHLHVKDLDRVMELVIAHDATYSEDVKTFLNGHMARFCNMFIMRRDIFDEYCAWMFPILEEFCRITDMSHYSKEGLRTPGHLSERLLNVFLMHNERLGRQWKTAELQCVHFENPDYHPDLDILVDFNDNRPVIPVVFAADNNYVPMLATTAYSAMQNASRAFRYDILVLHRNISWTNQDLMQKSLEQFDGVAIRFYNVDCIIEKYRLTTNNAHISVETYYRFLVQELLPFYNKVLYLDSDLIVKGDISELFETELGNNYLAAVPDVDFAGNVNIKNSSRAQYAKSILGMTDPFAYFQAGVLLLNIRAMREAYSMDQWLKYASDDKLIYNDQDVLNAHCEGRVIFLDFSWNVMTDCAGRIDSVFSFAPAEMFDAYLRSRSNEMIVHYAGFEKPWNTPSCDRAELYWSYARKTPFYESLLSQLLRGAHSDAVHPARHERAISQESKVRRIADPILPIGSNRREIAKALVRALRGRR